MPNTSPPSAKPETCEFGKGLCYCLGLFLAHAASLGEYLKDYKRLRDEGKNTRGYYSEFEAVNMWVQGAGDHLFEFDAESAPESLRTRCIALKERILEQRCSHMSDHYVDKMDAGQAVECIDEAKELLRLIDESHGIHTLTAEYK